MENMENEKMGGRKRSAWMSHVKATMKANKGKTLTQVLKMAKKTYKKTKKGGSSISPSPVGSIEGGKRKRGGKTRRGGRKY